jgi:predicted metal-dependent peptidase
MREPMTMDEKLDIAASIENYHRIFYVFWGMASAYFTDEIATAAVELPKGQKPTLLINREFWNSLSDYTKMFVIIHECLHVLLDHGTRNGKNIKGATPRLINTAQDITINEIIIDVFQLKRHFVDDWEKYCWIDTCFDQPQLVKRNETFEYYLKLLIQEKKEDLPEILDQHFSDELDEEAVDQETIDEIAEEIAKELPQDVLEKLKERAPGKAGNAGSPIDKVIAAAPKPPKINFTKLVAKLKRTSMIKKPIDVESFVRQDRRFATIEKDYDICLPGKHEGEKVTKGRLLTAIFMDVSGSCVSYFNKFVEIYSAFEAEKETFELRGFAFDTWVREIKPNQRISIGGGTNFQVIEDQVLKLEQECGRYPDCVVVITDGEGTMVAPKLAKRWIWILTPPACKTYIPPGSKSFLVKDIVF